MRPAQKWAADLAAWAVPEHILEQAEEMPWTHPVALFTVAGKEPDTPSHRVAREALPHGGSVLDVGCGGGRAAMALSEQSGLLIGVDESRGMLQAFASAAQQRGVPHREILGRWPDAAAEAPAADVVTCHHVVFNVPDIEPFLDQLASHASRRVVIEAPATHPQANLNPLWERLWGVIRPTAPHAEDLARIVSGMGLEPHIERWSDPAFGNRSQMTPDDLLEMTRIRLCLPRSRTDELAAALAEAGEERPRELVTLWWDTPQR